MSPIMAPDLKHEKKLEKKGVFVGVPLPYAVTTAVRPWERG